jgi:hypothetical protein
MPQSNAPERRRYPRFHGSGLMVNIGGKLVHVAAISATGMKLETGFKVGPDPTRFTLYPCKGGKVDINHGIGGTCRLVREDNGFVAMRFEPASYRLVKFVAECTNAALDQDP